MASTPAPIDPRGPRTNQAILAGALLLGFLAGQWLVVPVFGVVLLLGAAFGPRWGPVLRFYASVIKPRLKPPHELEDPRPPRFAASVGVLFLSSSTIAFLAGASTLGWTLALIVAALAAAAATTGLCVGCEMYVLFVRIRGGVRVVTIEREESKLFDAERPERKGGWAPVPAAHQTGKPLWLVFTTEFCAVCPLLVEQISTQRPKESILVLNVAEHLDLASIYKVRRAPTVVRADAEGIVIVRLSGVDAVRAELDALERETIVVG
ncbi:MAG: DUF4395 family protein [Actinobacteria bacterium]|nr:DUF4395 family protein [Actinomycetota bacterium]